MYPEDLREMMAGLWEKLPLAEQRRMWEERGSALRRLGLSQPKEEETSEMDKSLRHLDDDRVGRRAPVQDAAPEPEEEKPSESEPWESEPEEEETKEEAPVQEEKEGEKEEVAEAQEEIEEVVDHAAEAAHGEVEESERRVEELQEETGKVIEEESSPAEEGEPTQEGEEVVEAEPEPSPEERAALSAPVTQTATDLDEVVGAMQVTLQDGLERAVEDARASTDATTVERMEEILREVDDATKMPREGSGAELSDEDLRARVLLLSQELRDRARQEAIRLNEFVRMQEGKWEERFTRFVVEQAEVLEQEVEQSLRHAEEKLREENDKWRHVVLQDAHREALLAAEQHLVRALGEVKRRESESAERRIGRLYKLQAQMRELERTLADRTTYEAVSHKVHKLQLATMGIWAGMDKGEPLTEEMEALRVAGEGDEVVQLAVQSMPVPMQLTGVASLRQLDGLFHDAISSARSAAMVPEDTSGPLGHALGYVLGRVVTWSVPSEEDEKRTAAAHEASEEKLGQMTPGEREAREAIQALREAESAMAREDLEGAVAALSKLRGRPKAVMSDFRRAASHRLAVEQTLRMLRAYTGTLTASLY